MSSIPENTLVKPCKCKNSVHISCFNKWYNFSKSNCEICGDNFSRINERRIQSNIIGNKLECKTFFPFDDFYPVPLMSNYDLVKVKDDDVFIYALMYLQCDRMINLLQSHQKPKTWGNILTYFKNGSMPSNYLKRNNLEAYNYMSKILEQYE